MKAPRAWLLILLIPVLIGLFRLRFDTDVLNLLPADIPAVEGLKLYQKHFAKKGEVIITVSATDAGAAETAARKIADGLQAASNLVSSAVWQPPWMNNLQETGEFIAWLWLSQPEEAWQRMAARLEPANAARTLDETRDRLATSLSPLDLARLSHDPFGLTDLGAGLSPQNRDWFASPDGTFRLIFVQARNDPGSLPKWDLWLEQLRETVKSVEVPGGIEVGFTGTPVFTVETATGMRRDMRQSIICTIAMIAALFWWAHRRFWPLCWMLVMLVSALSITMSLGGLIFGSLNVVSFGFAAILLGLGVDYALVLYQELLAERSATATQIRQRAGAGIWWSSTTTALAFALLNFAGLPGLGQLGTLVAIGIILAAALMLYGFLPLMTRRPPPYKSSVELRRNSQGDRLAWPATIALILLGAVVLSMAWPGIDRTSRPLGSVNSEAAKAAGAIDREMNRGSETVWLVVQAANEAEMRGRLEALQTEFKTSEIDLPLEVWPVPNQQKQNIQKVRILSAALPQLEKAAAEAGFTEEGMTLTKSVLKSWQSMPEGSSAIWPRGAAAEWIISRIAATSDDRQFALGMLRLAPNTALPEIKTPSVLAAGWSRLAGALLAKVEKRLAVLTMGMLGVLIICLRLALGNWRGVLLSFMSLAFGFMLTLLVMALCGWEWNLISLTAIPLLLGASVDYTIHVQLALKRYHGDARAMRQTIGRALFLVTAAAVAGFGSLGFASNAGLASFEILCAIGMISIFLTSLYLLPAWHYSLAKRERPHG